MIQHWITLDKLYPMPDELVEIERDQKGERRTMRIPCVAFEEMTRLHPDRLYRFRLCNRAKVGDEVILKYHHTTGSLKGVTEGRVIRRDGGYVYLMVEVIRDAVAHVVEIEVYDNEIMVKADVDFMSQHGSR